MTAEDSRTRPDLQIQVHRPLTWWRATSDQIADRLQDPDLGNIPRWPSYDQDWKAIGTTVSAAADAIAAGNYSLDPDQQDTGVVQVPDPGLGVTGKRIVHSWFRSSASVTSDPWINEWSDGRHRTWHTAQANPGIALPVRGDSIGFANSYDIPHLGAHWEKRFQHYVQRLAALKWFDRSDPLNAQFTRSLQIAATGKIPPVILEKGQNRQATRDPELEAMHKHMAASFPQPASTILQRPPQPGPEQLKPTQPQSQQARSRQSFGR